jgi:hypothetical protein
LYSRLCSKKLGGKAHKALRKAAVAQRLDKALCSLKILNS